MLPGLDLLGLAHPKFKVKEVLKAFPQGFALGCFDDPKTFGDALKRIKLFLDSGKVSALRVHVHWDDAHRIANLNDLKKRLPRYEKLQQQYPNIPVYVSHSCEYRESSAREVQKRVELVRDLCPSCRVVQSAWQSPTITGVGVIEKHGPGAKCGPGQIASYDGGKKGEGINDIDSEKWVNNNANADICFLWTPLFNLTESEKVPRPKRTASPTDKYIKAVARLAAPKGSAPAHNFAKEPKPLKKPMLWKSFAEDTPGESKRDNKPLVILKKKTARVDIVTCLGQKIGSLAYYGTYTGGLHRYYSGIPGGVGLYAYEIGEKAKKLSGSEWIYFKQGGEIFGPVCAPFRAGYMYVDI